MRDLTPIPLPLTSKETTQRYDMMRVMRMTIDRLRNKGASIVEFALISSFMIYVIFAIFEFGRYMFVEHTIEYASQEGARLAQVGGTTSAIRAKINAAAGLAVNTNDLLVYGYSGNDLNNYAELYPNPVTLPPPLLANDATTAGLGGAYRRLRIRYTFRFILPFIKPLFPSGLLIIDATVLYRNEKF